MDTLGLCVGFTLGVLMVPLFLSGAFMGNLVGAVLFLGGAAGFALGLVTVAYFAHSIANARARS